MRKLVVKSNKLIQSSYTLGLVEQRIILMAIVEARDTGEGVTPDSLLHIRADDYAKLFNVTKQAAYKALTEAAETLFNRRVTIQVFDKVLSREVPVTVRWITAMNYLENEALVTLCFSPQVVPHITRLESNFTTYEIEKVSDLQSAYSVRLYELLTKWLSVGKTPLLELSEFRGQLGLEVGEYERMQHFKSRVLDLAIEQINTNTDITASYDQHKSGRVITGFTFSVKAKKIKAAAAPKKAITEKQIDWVGRDTALSADVVKILTDFDSLTSTDKDFVLNHIQTELSGLRRSQFDIELSVYNATKSPSIFKQYKDYFARGLALLGIN